MPRSVRSAEYEHAMNRTAGCIVLLVVVSSSLPVRAQSPCELRWGGDAEGGSPFVEADPNDPSRVVGFEVEIAGLLAEGLGRTPRFLQVGFTSLDAAAARGDFDIGLSGIEDSPARQSRLAVTIPYYQFREIPDGPRRRCRRVSHARGSARPTRRDARRHARVRSSRRRASRSSASCQSSTRTMCIPIPT